MTEYSAVDSSEVSGSIPDHATYAFSMFGHILFYICLSEKRMKVTKRPGLAHYLRKH